jgi:hypothetical protein
MVRSATEEKKLRKECVSSLLRGHLKQDRKRSEMIDWQKNKYKDPEVGGWPVNSNNIKRLEHREM